MNPRLALLAPAAALALAACGSEPEQKAPVAPRPVDTTNYTPSCPAASLETSPHTRPIVYREGTLEVQIASTGDMIHRPALNTAGPQPTTGGPAWRSWRERQVRDRAIISGNYETQANYAFDRFARACPDTDITELRRKLIANSRQSPRPRRR